MGITGVLQYISACGEYSKDAEERNLKLTRQCRRENIILRTALETLQVMKITSLTYNLDFMRLLSRTFLKQSFRNKVSNCCTFCKSYAHLLCILLLLNAFFISRVSNISKDADENIELKRCLK